MQEAPGFDLNHWELRRWGITSIWAARDGKEIDRARLRVAWKADVAIFKKWAYRLWAVQRANPTVNRKYPSFGSTRTLRVRRSDIPTDVTTRLRDSGPRAVYQSAGCTPAEVEALSILHDGKTYREVAGHLGISLGATRDRISSGLGKLRDIGISKPAQDAVNTCREEVA
jgi:DNA-binding CsgD family transcriptional regulator